MVFKDSSSLPTTLITIKDGNYLLANEVGSDTTYDTYNDFAYISTSNLVTVGPENPLGVIVQIPEGLAKDYLYSFTAYVCSTSNASRGLVHTNDTIRVSSNYSNITNNETYEFNYLNSLTYLSSDKPPRNLNYNLSGITSFGRCYTHTYLLSPKSDSAYIRYNLRLSNDTSAYYSLYGYKFENLGLYNSTTVEEVKNEVIVMQEKQQEANEKLDEVNDNITSDNTDKADNQGSGFFNDFATSDNGGISGIITAPLTLINGMVDGNNKCDNLEINLSFLGKNKEVYLPSGCIMWNKAPDSAVALYQTLLCGVFGYILMINLFKEIQDLKNPKDEEVDTLDL